MKFLAVATALLHVALASHVAVRLPYLNPAGVSYVGGGSLEGYEGHAAHVAQAFEHQQPFEGYGQYPQPLHYQAPAAAHIETHHVGYAAAQVPAVAAVPVVKHVPAVADVPVTHIEAQHGFIEKQVDVAKPAVSTRKFEVRRPAIQKHFYDIEEHVVVRPAGTALVELDEPISKSQKGPTVVHPIAHAAPLSVTPVPDHDHHHHQEVLHHQFEAQHQDLHQIQEATVHVTPTPGYIHETPVHVTQAPIYQHETVHHVTQSPIFVSSPTPTPVIVSSTPEPHYDNTDSVVVENIAFRNSAASVRQKERQLEDLQHQQETLQAELNAERSAHIHSAHANQYSGVVTHSNGAPLPLEHNIARIAAAHEAGPSVVHSVKAGHEESKANQHKLIDLLTARGGVAEVGFGREGPASYVGDAGHVRARVLSATPAPDHVQPTGERVSTRRVVVSRPIETVQEFDVVEPATKVERVSYQEPTLIKTARTHRVKVPTSVPVYGKALAPAVAHAAVPVFQKTISHAPEYESYYHH